MEALETSDDFNYAPYSATYVADQEIHGMLFIIQQEESYLHSSAARSCSNDLQLTGLLPGHHIPLLDSPSVWCPRWSLRPD